MILNAIKIRTAGRESVTLRVQPERDRDISLKVVACGDFPFYSGSSTNVDASLDFLFCFWS